MWKKIRKKSVEKEVRKSGKKKAWKEKRRGKSERVKELVETKGKCEKKSEKDWKKKSKNESIREKGKKGRKMREEKKGKWRICILHAVKILKYCLNNKELFKKKPINSLKFSWYLKPIESNQRPVWNKVKRKCQLDIKKNQFLQKQL